MGAYRKIPLLLHVRYWTYLVHVLLVTWDWRWSQNNVRCTKYVIAVCLPQRFFRFTFILFVACIISSIWLCSYLSPFLLFPLFPNLQTLCVVETIIIIFEFLCRTSTNIRFPVVELFYSFIVIDCGKFLLNICTHTAV